MAYNIVRTKEGEQMTYQAHSKNLRQGRRSFPGQIYLITTCTELRRHYFSNLWVGRCVVNALRDAQYASTLAFVVMPDHLHWLMALEDKSNLSQTVQFVKTHAARQCNRLIGRTGKLWQPGFHDHALRRDEDIQACARYIIANPLRAGLVKEIGHYPLWDAVYF